MKILFESIGVGLVQNGGSYTIVKSVNTLVKLGHEVTIIDSMKNQHTWIELIGNHLIPRLESDIPSADVVIATWFKSVSPMMKLPSRCGKKYHWIRGWETWQMSEKKIVSYVLNPPSVKLVNSIGLQQKLLEFGIQSYIVRPGNDINDIYIMKMKKKKLILGGLYNVRHKTKRSQWIFQTVKFIRETCNKKICLWMFGSHPDPKNPIINKYFQEPNIEEKNFLYNNVSLWLSPSSLEGLHIVPQEAMLAGCPVITTDTKLGGTRDYIINLKTGLIVHDDLDSFKKGVKSIINDNKLRGIMSKNCREKIISLGSREENMEKMVKLFKETI